MTQPKDSKIERTCPACGAVFLTTPKRLREGAGKHCSRACAVAALRGDQEVRFHDRVDRSAGPDACWTWIGPVDKACGRGRLKFRGRLRYAQHVAWEIVKLRDLPKHADIEVLCGNRLCCNPAHLRWLASDDPERFWSLVDRSGGPESCWPWTGGLNEFGYGLVYINGKTFTAHRHAWRLTHGEPPVDLCCCHACDRPICCNPTHLWLGTNEENIADRHAKGRSLPPRNTGRARGESSGVAKLTESDVRAIRADFAAGAGGRRELARRFGVTPENIDAVVQRKTWKHVHP